MRLFLEISFRSLQRQLVYRTAAFAGLATNFFFGIIRIAVLMALYGARQEVSGISIHGATTFTGLSQAAIGFLSLFSWYDLMTNVYIGAISSDMLKPMSLFYYWLAHDFGRAIGQFLLRSLPMMAAYAVLIGITTPDNVLQWLSFILSLVLAWLVSFSWRFLVNLAAFWIPNAAGFVRFAFVISWFMSGFLMPLRYFPDWFVKVCSFTPFPHTVNTIIEIYLGVLQGPEVVLALFAQFFWGAGLILVSQVVLHFGIRKLVILGG